MRRLLNIYTLASLLLVSVFVYGQTIERGIPFFKNFSAQEYDANNQNFDVLCDDYGTLFVANFEGLLYFDAATWRKVYTPGISRITRVEKGPDGKIWVAGYNVLGYLVADKNGSLQIKTIISDKDNKNNEEFDALKVVSGQIYAHTTMGKVYKVESNETVSVVPNGANPLFADANNEGSSLMLPDGVRAEYGKATGLRFLLPNREFIDITETNGLVSNSIYSLAFNNRNALWGATSNGLFCAEVATPYSKLSETEGLKGEVYAINQIGSTIYIGTQNGLYTLKSGNVEAVPEIDLACWDLVKDSRGRLLAPTTNGLFIISEGGIKKINSENTMSVSIAPDGQDFIVGETGGVFRVNESGKREQLSKLEKVMYQSSDGNLILCRTIYGSQWLVPSDLKSGVQERCVNQTASSNVCEVDYTDCFGRLWQTDADGYNLAMKTRNREEGKLPMWIYPLTQLAVEAVHVCQDGNILVGGDFGVIIIAASADNIKIGDVEKPYIRSVTASDSVMWGGYSPDGLKPLTDIADLDIPQDNRDITITFSTRTNSLASPTQYRYRLNGGSWSKWSTDPYVNFRNMEYGGATLEIQALDSYGRQSGISTVKWYVHYPLYRRWWAFVIYALLIAGLVSLYFRWRTKKLQKDKVKLEGIISERTSELRDTLDDLQRTQADLVRMERTATAGKLTQGLIDRILNPINYINNFSKLTSNLAKDLHEDIEDEKENMSEDNYEDCEDILGMMDQNLQKIEEHGVNTTRTLRAMEAMLNTHIGTLVEQNILPLCTQAVKVAGEYHKDVIADCGIKLTTDIPDTPVVLNIDAESFNRVLISLLTNSIYAVEKKYQQCPFNAEVKLTVEVNENVVLTIHDNGIGIEDSIKDKVFDPFFTTKPTGVAAGVGLYIARELIHDHNADITLSSDKGQYCDFVITFSPLTPH